MVQQQLGHLLYTYHDFAIILSIFMNIVISIVGFIPSAFLTAINIKLFGLAGGFTVSMIGESLGAMVSFWLYRRGFQTYIQNKITTNSNIRKLLVVKGKKAFWLILALRLIPFVPSSLVTLYAALGKVSWGVFTLASTIGKVPALLLECYSVFKVLNSSLFHEVLLGVIVLSVLLFIWRLKKE